MNASQDPTYPLFPVFAFLGFVLCCIPLSWHIQAWNSGTCAFMIWTAVACLIEFVNCIVWTGNVNNPAPVWCDISSKIILGVSVGIPASTLCISRRLYYLTSCHSASITRQDKRRMVIIDLCIAVGAPLIIMALHYVVQGHRFDILEDIGCYPVVYNTLPAYFLYFMWPVVFGLISFVFSALTLRGFWIRRAQFNQLIRSNSSMSIARYFRLILLSVLDILCTVPIAIYSIYIDNKGVGLAPWISWDITHFNFSHVDLVPAILWRSDPSFLISVELTRWLPVVCAFLFFALFGFASEAQKQYNTIFQRIMMRIGVRPSSTAPAKGSTKISFPGWKKSPISSKSSITSLPEYTPKSLNSYNHHSHSVELEFNTCSTLDVEKSARHSPVLSEFSTIAGSRALRDTSLRSLASRDIKFTSPTFVTHDSHLTQTDPSSLCRPITQFSQAKETGQSQGNVPGYASNPYSYPEVYIACELPTTDDSDAFTISTFSYGGTSSPSSPSHRFDLTQSTLPSELRGLSPPPLCPVIKRPIPRDVPSSADSIMDSPSRPLSPVLPANTTDVTQSLPGRRAINIPASIFVTVQRQSSVDRMV